MNTDTAEAQIPERYCQKLSKDHLCLTSGQIAQMAKELGKAEAENRELRAQNEWVSVKDRLPDCDYHKPLSEIVFGTTGDNNVGLYRYWWRYHQFERLVTPEGWERKVKLTHWMPMPKPPSL